MNYSRAIFLISDDVRAIDVTYEPDSGATRTTFKTLNQDIKVDDYVVVPTNTRHEMTVCKVAEVDVEPDLESSAKMEWVVGVVNRANFEDITNKEGEAIEKIRIAERKRKRRELRESLIAGHDEDIKALPIYTISDEDEAKG